MWHVRIEEKGEVFAYVAGFNNIELLLSERDDRHMFLKGYDAASVSYFLNQRYEASASPFSAKVIEEDSETIRQHIYAEGLYLYESCGFKIDEAGEFFGEIVGVDGDDPAFMLWRIPSLKGGYDTIAIHSDHAVCLYPEGCEMSLTFDDDPTKSAKTYQEMGLNGRWYRLASEFWHLAIKYKEPLEELWSSFAVEV